jgi:hypothetical protein
LVGLIADYRERHVTPGHLLLIPLETGRPLTNTTVARMRSRAAKPSRCRARPSAQAPAHPGDQGDQPQDEHGSDRCASRPPQPGHDPPLPHAHARTVADAYFTVGDEVDALYAAHPLAPPLTELHLEMSARLLGNGYCTRPRQLQCDHDSAFENCVHSTGSAAPRVESLSECKRHYCARSR